MSAAAEGGSFRDPAGFVFRSGGALYRQVNGSYRADYDALMGSGLYAELSGAGLLVRHEEAPGVAPPDPGRAYKVIRPEEVPFVSYPYEWSFGQLRAAALATLSAQEAAMRRGMTLKDASAYNVQFDGGRPVVIDTLSFERYEEGQFWAPYGQFCRHFVAPLALMAHRDVRLGQLLRVHVDGVPLDLASSLLPARTRAMFSLAAHVHAHARSQRRHGASGRDARGGRRLGRRALEGIVSSLRSAVSRMSWDPGGTEWGDYYSSTSYTGEAFELKKAAVRAAVEADRPGTVWDLGANTGVFSGVAAEGGARVVAFDSDPAAVEKGWRACEGGGGRVLPLLLDLSNPSPPLGWAGEERASLAARGPADMALALALVHHLALSNNLPLPRIASFLAGVCRSLVVEFVPKEDPQARLLLASRDDIFGGYTREGFEEAFAGPFEAVSARPLPGPGRVVYHMRARGSGGGAASPGGPGAARRP